MNSIRVLQEMKIEYDYYELSGDSYVDRAKNSLVDHFLKSDGTHMMMIDSDLEWDTEGFARLLKASLIGAEVVGGSYPNKNNWTTFGCMPMYSDDGYILGKEIGETRLLEMYGIPGGFIIYSREAFERTRSNLKTYNSTDEKITILECFRCNVEADGTRIGEDIYFQKRYREMGGKVWLEPNIRFVHYGVKGWKGNYHEYLLRQKLVAEAEGQK